MHEYWGRQRVLISPNMRKYFDFFPGNGFSPCLGNGQKSALRAHRKYTVTQAFFFYVFAKTQFLPSSQKLKAIFVQKLKVGAAFIKIWEKN